MTNKNFIGLDIGDFNLKGIEIAKTTSGKLKIVSAGMEKLKRGYSFNDLISTLRVLLSNLKISHNRVNVSVSGKSVISRYLLFPIMPKQNIIKSLKFEFDKYVPFPMEECVVDIDILGKTQDNKKLNVLIVSAKKEVIDEKLRIFNELNLIPNVITTDSLALSKIFLNSSYNVKDSSFALLNIGCNWANLAIIKKGFPIFSRDINIGGELFTRVISDKIGLNLEKAEEEKYSLSLDRTDIFADMYSLTNEIQLSLEYSKKVYGLDEVSCIYVSGGSSRLSGLEQFLTDNLNLKCSLWNPFASFDKPADTSVLDESYQELILSAGIALS